MGILPIPKRALGLLVSSKYLLLLSFLPGLITLFFTVSGIYFIWHQWLAELSVWFAYPLVIIIAPILWIVVGNVSIVPFEDLIIDRVQLLIWGKVKIPAPDFRPHRFVKEAIYSLTVSILFLLLLLLSFIPGFAFFSYIVAAWITAWSFLATLYARRQYTLSSKVSGFFKHTIQHTLLGIFLNILLFVPIVNVWLLGYALVISTLLVLDKESA